MPAPTVVILAMVGLCKVEVKPLGPVQFQLVALVAPPVNVKVLPSQIGLGAADAVTLVGAEVQPAQPNDTHAPPAQYSKHIVVVLKMSKDVGIGAVMPLRSTVVMRGMSKPVLGFPSESISSIALVLGAAPVVFMPMFWAKAPPRPSPKGRESQHTRLMQNTLVSSVVVFLPRISISPIEPV